MPWRAAQPLIASTVSPPSSGPPAACSTSGGPIAFHFSGRTTRSAPAAAASSTRLSASSRFPALSGPLVICTHATRRVSLIRPRIALGRGGDGRTAVAGPGLRGPAAPGFTPALPRPGGVTRRRRSVLDGARVADVLTGRLVEVGRRPRLPVGRAARDRSRRRRAGRPLLAAPDDDRLRPDALRGGRRPCPRRRERAPHLRL